MIGRCLLAAAAALASLEPPEDRPSALINGQILAPYFAALSQAKDPASQRKVNILQIGDSHSAGDSISGAWRAQLQARFGFGGRGVLPPGRPFDGFLPHEVTVQQSDGWEVQNIFKTSAGEGSVFGLSGFRLTARNAGPALTMTADPEADFDSVVVCAENGPGAGSYVLTSDTDVIAVSLDAPVRGVSCATTDFHGQKTSVQLRVDRGPVTLTSWASYRGSGGLTVSNLGVVGAQIRDFARTDDQALGEELRAYRPDLILLEFGVNDGFVSRFDEYGFRMNFRNQILRLKKFAPGVPILVLGAPDAETNRPGLAHNLGADDTSGAPASPAAGAWYAPPALGAVRAIERSVALEQHVAFWDWAARVGGEGAAVRLAGATPALMRMDHVHFTSEGGRVVAGYLQQDLDEAAASLVGVN